MLHRCDPFKAVVALIRFLTKQLLGGEQSCNVKNTLLGSFCVRASKGANKGKENTATGCVGRSNDTTELISKFINIMVSDEIRYNVGFISFT